MLLKLFLPEKGSPVRYIGEIFRIYSCVMFYRNMFLNFSYTVI